MPYALVYVTTNPKLVTDDHQKKLGPFLAQLAATTLACQKDNLATKDVEVAFREPGPNDINVRDLQVEVSARDVGERAKNKNAHERHMRAAIKKSGILPKKIMNGRFLVVIRLHG